MSEKTRLYVQTKTTYNSFIGTFYSGNISGAVKHFVDKETVPEKNKFVIRMLISDLEDRIFME